ncbi:MAG: HAD-IA family hydrolase [Acholeplasmatales bacterium]|nr:HAD-IA family hydrolase [Acholeplasmatales bacterium]
MFKYVFLDLDGTLTDPFLGITNSVKYALKKFNIDAINEELKCFIGPPLVDSFIDYYDFTYEDAIKAKEYYREVYSTKGLFENEIYSNTEKVLKELKKLGCTLVLATSKPEKFSIQILKHFNIYDYFSFCACATLDETRNKKGQVIKYAIDSLNITNNNEILMVGDRFHDVVGAKENDIKSCYVTYGYGSVDEAKKYGANYIIDDFNDLIKIIKDSI